MKFAYQRYEVEPTAALPEGVLYRPEIPIRVIGPTGDASFLALIDTGADETILPRSIGEAVGVTIDDSHQSDVAGIGGQLVSVSYGEVEFELRASSRKTYRWSAIVGFAAVEPEAASAILGHAGCLNYFRLRCDVEQCEVELKPNGLFPQMGG